ncbi:MAG: deoxyribose-phosphate aldolase [Clostridia bacterium]|nr:deoxyribose-phosphate aldolase [Clostridia bacterium]
MTNDEILHICDHTVLRQDANFAEIAANCELAMKYHCASMCLAPSFVNAAKKLVGDRLKICTVIGFPNGYNDTATKLYEANRMIELGADEIDAVINLGNACAKEYTSVGRELEALRMATEGKVLKIIVETCFLSTEVLREICHVVSDSGTDFIKTSTGFGKYGARVEDVAIMRSECDPKTKIKAAGGISSFEDARAMIEAGADRLGTSRLIKIMESN